MIPELPFQSLNHKRPSKHNASDRPRTGCLWCKADIKRQAKTAASVENDPFRKSHPSQSQNQGIVRYTHAIIATAGITHTHPNQKCRVERSGNDAATTPNTSAPSAAVAVQPYQ